MIFKNISRITISSIKKLLKKCKYFKPYNKMKMITAAELHTILKDNFKIIEQKGFIQIVLGGITANYNGRDAIGDLLQEWIKEWLTENDYYFSQRSNTQMFPDFILSQESNKGFLELKTFNADASPAFDIANFDSYCTSLLTTPERLDADYLIISYRMKNSVLTIDNIWLKKVWELACPSGQDPIKLQVKRGQVYNIRPCTWYSTRLSYEPFTSRRDFVKAIHETHSKYPQCDQYKDGWLDKVLSLYKERTGTDL